MDIETSDHTRFSEHMRVWNAGGIDDEITEGISELVRAVRVTGKKGTMTLEITITPEDKDGQYVSLALSKLAVKAPQERRRPALMYATFGGDLLRQDPTQMPMDLRTVEAPAQAAPKNLFKNSDAKGEKA